MNEINIYTKYTRRILEIYLQKPAESFDYIKLRKLLPTLGETTIRDALRALKRSNILEVSHQKGRLHSGKGTERYSISNDLAAFKKLSEMYHINGIDEFIKSEYINKVKEKFTPILKAKAGRFGFKSIIDFIELDIHLSPITSIQSTFPPKLLLCQPFDRIFSDVYILNKDDIKKLIKRAYIVYSNFPEIFSSAIKYTITQGKDNRNHMADIESLVKQAIFYWNISSHNFDWVFSCLMDALQSEEEMEFYIEFVDGVTEIRELKNEPGSLPLYLANDTLVGNYFMSEPVQFGSLRPCICFGKNVIGEETMTYERIVSEVRAHFQGLINP